MPATWCKIASLLALPLSLIKQWAIVVQLERCIPAIWNMSMGRSFLDPTFDLNLQGSTSGTPETGREEERLQHGGGS